MKSFAVLFFAFTLSMVAVQAKADSLCQVSYGVGIGHVFKGETRDITPRNRPFSQGAVEDNALRIEVMKSDVQTDISITRKDTGGKLDVQRSNLGPLDLFTAEIPADLEGRAAIVHGTPGAAAGKSIYLFVLCAPVK